VALVTTDPIAVHLRRGISRYNDSIREVTNTIEAIQRPRAARLASSIM
jgi:hypothetical protein